MMKSTVIKVMCKKELNKLKYEYHEERRQKEEAKRTSDEAIAHAQRLVEENKKLRKTIR